MRREIDDDMADRAIKLVPAPPGFEWLWDPAASGDRLRLFHEPAGGQVGFVYACGSWAVDDPKAPHLTGASGQETDLVNGMLRMLKVARALGGHFPASP